MTLFHVFCQVHSYALLRDVVGALKRPNMEGRQFKHHPLLVMNGFSGDGMHLKLMTTMFQNLFPSINVNTVRTEVHLELTERHLADKPNTTLDASAI